MKLKITLTIEEMRAAIASYIETQSGDQTVDPTTVQFQYEDNRRDYDESPELVGAFVELDYNKKVN